MFNTLDNAVNIRAYAVNESTAPAIAKCVLNFYDKILGIEYDQTVITYANKYINEELSPTEFHLIDKEF